MFIRQRLLGELYIIMLATYFYFLLFFPQVLATGLSGLYSSLPRKIEVRGDDWHALRREDWMGVSSLVLFMNSLEFCNAVVQVAHPLVRCQLLDYLHNGFLVPVMGPALHKVNHNELGHVWHKWQFPYAFTIQHCFEWNFLFFILFSSLFFSLSLMVPLSVVGGWDDSKHGISGLVFTQYHRNFPP